MYLKNICFVRVYKQGCSRNKEVEGRPKLSGVRQSLS